MFEEKTYKFYDPLRSLPIGSNTLPSCLYKEGTDLGYGFWTRIQGWISARSGTQQD
jgi:hypothetical protein